MDSPPGPDGIDVVGPIRADVYLVWLKSGRIEITGPDGPRPWIVQLDEAEHPVAAVERIIAGLVGPPLLVHSTSWRREGTALILSFVAVIGADQVNGMESRGVLRAELARSGRRRRRTPSATSRCSSTDCATWPGWPPRADPARSRAPNRQRSAPRGGPRPRRWRSAITSSRWATWTS